MRIAALLPHDALQVLERCAGPADTLTRVLGAVSLVRALSTLAADVIVIDPSELSATDWIRARHALQAAHVPVLVYASLEPASVKRVLSALALGSPEVLLRGVDDDPAAVRRRLESVEHPTPPARVLATLASRIEKLPESLQGVTVPLFCAGPVPRWVDSIALASGVPRRSVDRCMLRAGLAGTAALLDAARLARVWVPLVDGRMPQAELALRCGYRRFRMLAVHTRRIVGVSPSHLGTRLSADEFVQRLARHAIRH